MLAGDLDAHIFSTVSYIISIFLHYITLLIGLRSSETIQDHSLDKPARLTIVPDRIICQIRYKRTNSETVTLSKIIRSNTLASLSFTIISQII